MFFENQPMKHAGNAMPPTVYITMILHGFVTKKLSTYVSTSDTISKYKEKYKNKPYKRPKTLCSIRRYKLKIRRLTTKYFVNEISGAKAFIRFKYRKNLYPDLE